MASITVVDGLDVATVRLFLDIVELGSVSKAATRRGLTQPSVTTRLQKFERQLGVQLLDRGPTGSRATDAGLRLAPACADVVASATALVDRAEIVGDDQRRLVIAATRHVADHFMPAWITGADLADVRVDLVEADTLAVAQAVRAGDAVLGFTEGPDAPLGLRSEVVASEEVLPVVGPRHPWYGARAVRGRDLVASTLALPRRGSGTLDVVVAALARFESAPGADRIEVASSAAARVAALNGPVVAFLPGCRVAGDLRSGALAIVPVRDLVIDQPVRAVWRGTRPPARAARRLVDALRTP